MRLPNTWIELSKELELYEGEEKQALLRTYHSQRLWPFDKNVASKLGIVVAFVMLSYIAVFNIAMLAG